MPAAIVPKRLQRLPRILDYLQTRGDTVVSLSTLLGTTRDALMPPAPRSRQSLSRIVSGTGFRIYHGVEQFLWAFMIVATALVVVRTLIVICLASRFRRIPVSDFTAPISVVIAAFNEEKVIANTLRSLLTTDYGGELEVIIVDDGSHDNTAAEVEADRESGSARETVAPAESRQSARAATCTGRGAIRDHCFSGCRYPLPKRHLARTCAAVCRREGRRSFGPRESRKLADVYRDVVRRSNTRWDSISIDAPTRAGIASRSFPARSARSARSAIDEAGGLSLETLAEDTDLTLTLHKRGQRIVYVPAAIAWTEAPETVRTLARQRFRWAYGTLQCLWKHRDMIFNWKYRALGWFSLPSVWFFQIILVAITPMIDLLLLASLPFGAWRAVLPFVVTFLAMDVILATLACILERESILRAWRILPMRLIYRPMLSYVIWKALLRAIKGALVGWGKLERTASVPVRA